MTNAIKFTPEGGVVTIAVEPKSAGLIIRITDTGIGISKEDIERLAQPFEQIDSQHSRQHEGTGLGLALSKSLVELHGGNFNIESKVGQGTTVTFTLPTKPPVVEEKNETTEVGSEITKLANDIADVLSAGQATVEASKSKTGQGQQNSSSQQSRPQSQAQTAPPQQTQPNPAAPPIRKALPPPQNSQKDSQSESSRPSNPYTDSAA